jgi:hypothetical protein
LHDTIERLATYLPQWDSNAPQINLDMTPPSRRRSSTTMRTPTTYTPLPNPLAYLRQDAWKKLRYDLRCPVGHIHGDLHTGNIVVGSGASGANVRLIDCEPLGESTLTGVPFFDLAYLEFDIMRQLLPMRRADLRPQWLELLDYSTSEVLSTTHYFHGWQAQAAHAWRLMQPIRQQVQRLIEIEPEYEMAWWLSTAVVGLNYARKGDDASRPAIERVASLIYAAFGLRQFLRKSTQFLERSKRHDQHVYRHANAILTNDETIAINGLPISL